MRGILARPEGASTVKRSSGTLWTVQPQVKHWYSALPDPDLPEIPVKRAYTEVLFVFGAFFAAGIILAGLILAGHTSDLTTKGSWGLYLANAVQICFQMGVAVVLVWLLAQRRGVNLAALGVRWPSLPDGRFAAGRTTRLLAWAVVAQVVGGLINAALQTGSLPKQQTNSPAMVFAVFDSLNAGVVEELVVLAFVVVTLRQARRPWWEVTAVALILRGSYHIYYGPGVVGILVWASLFYWLYLRTRTLLPLMVSHAAWDMVAFLGQRWPAVAGVAVLAGIGLLIAAPITWLVERNNKPPPPGSPPWGAGPYAGWRPNGGPPTYTAVPAPGAGWVPGPAPPSPVGSPAGQAVGVPAHWAAATATPGPGWHPDPSGLNQWRWWDGLQWTGYVSGHAAQQ